LNTWHASSFNISIISHEARLSNLTSSTFYFEKLCSPLVVFCVEAEPVMCLNSAVATNEISVLTITTMIDII
jgi:hypothetical protein